MSKRRIISLIGAPGSGKSVIARGDKNKGIKGAAELLNLHYISTGDIARKIHESDENNRLNLGALGDEEGVRAGVIEAVAGLEDGDIIIDGMPRFMDQLHWFEKTFGEEFDIRYVFIDVPHRVCFNRVLERGRNQGDSIEATENRFYKYEKQVQPMLPEIWHSTFKPAPHAPINYVVIDFCRFLLQDRVVERRVKIELLEDHPLYGKSPEEIEAALEGLHHTKAFLFKKYDGDAGLDLFVTKRVVIPARGKANINTSIRIEIPPFYWYAIDKRSSTFFRRDMLVIEAVIDNGYRGELFCTVHNPTNEDKVLEVGESVAQIVFHELVGYDFKLELAKNLSESDRKDNGFGSTTEHKEMIQDLYRLHSDNK